MDFQQDEDHLFLLQQLLGSISSAQMKHTTEVQAHLRTLEVRE